VQPCPGLEAQNGSARDSWRRQRRQTRLRVDIFHEQYTEGCDAARTGTFGGRTLMRLSLIRSLSPL
jgi:hypothetical protein